MHSALSAVLFVMISQSPSAEEQDDFQEYVNAGLRLYQDKRFAEAAVEFEAAYAVRPEPALIYNAARCYEQIPRLDQAVAKYRQFLDLGGTSAEQRVKARRALSALEAELIASQPPPPPPPPVAEPDEAPSLPPTPPPSPAATIVTEAPKTRSYLAEGLLFGAAGIGLAVGTTFAFLAQNKADESPLAVTLDEQQEVEDAARSRALIADIAFGAAGAAAVAGVVLLVTRSGEDESISFGPTVIGDGAGIVFGGKL